MRERQRLEDGIARDAKRSTQELDDNVELIELGEAEGDAGDRRRGRSGDPLAARRGQGAARSRRCSRARPTPTTPISKSIPAPAAPRARTGPTMLLRMYTRWAERQRFKVEVLEVHDGEEAGIKSATLLVKGHNAYGWLKTESGVHRLVRISPYDSNARRHTSLRQRLGLSGRRRHDRDRRSTNRMCRIDTYRSSGAGGQHVNTTDSAVRITHIADRHRRRLPGGALAAQEPGQGLGHAARPPLRGRAEEARGGGQRRGGVQDRHRLGPPDPLLRAAALSAGEGSAHRRREHQPVRTCSTATSTSSWKPRCRSASRAARAKRWRIWTSASRRGSEIARSGIANRELRRGATLPQARGRQRAANPYSLYRYSLFRYCSPRQIERHDRTSPSTAP